MQTHRHTVHTCTHVQKPLCVAQVRRSAWPPQHPGGQGRFPRSWAWRPRPRGRKPSCLEAEGVWVLCLPRELCQGAAGAESSASSHLAPLKQIARCALSGAGRGVAMSGLGWLFHDRTIAHGWCHWSANPGSSKLAMCQSPRLTARLSPGDLRLKGKLHRDLERQNTAMWSCGGSEQGRQAQSRCLWCE